MKTLTVRTSLNLRPQLSVKIKTMAEQLETTEQKLIRGILNKVLTGGISNE